MKVRATSIWGGPSAKFRLRIALFFKTAPPLNKAVDLLEVIGSKSKLDLSLKSDTKVFEEPRE